MSKIYESPVLDTVSIKVDDIMKESNELPEIELYETEE